MEIRSAESGDVALAYVLEGESGLPLIFIPGIVSNLAMDGSVPPLARFYERVSRFSRFVRWGRRGTGLPDQSADPLPLAEQARGLGVEIRAGSPPRRSRTSSRAPASRPATRARPSSRASVRAVCPR